ITARVGTSPRPKYRTSNASNLRGSAASNTPIPAARAFLTRSRARLRSPLSATLLAVPGRSTALATESASRNGLMFGQMKYGRERPASNCRSLYDLGRGLGIVGLGWLRFTKARKRPKRSKTSYENDRRYRN